MTNNRTKKKEAANQGKLEVIDYCMKAVAEVSNLLEALEDNPLLDDCEFSHQPASIAMYLIKSYLDKEIADMKKKLPNYDNEKLYRMAIANLAFEVSDFFDVEE